MTSDGYEDYRVPVAEQDRTKAGVALHVVSALSGVPVAQMTRLRTTPRATRARWIAMYLAHVAFGWTLERVGHVFGLNRATAGTACRWVEDERDQLEFDRVVDGMERTIGALFALPRIEVQP
ncbi:MAG: chromosomal replication initiator DnaA [Brevundimonas sp.]|nr:MAG: chromosomal replication initiator DnaA [Brevundimonas sp.]